MEKIVNKYMKIKVIMKVNLIMDLKLEKEVIIGPMGKYILVNLKMDLCKNMELFKKDYHHIFKVNFNKIKYMGLE